MSAAAHRVSRRLFLAGVGAAATSGLACAHGQNRASAGDPTAEAKRVLVDVASIPVDFVARQRLAGSMGEHSLSSDVVLQKQGATLTLIGLTPFGTKAFALIQEGLEISFEAFVDAALPFPPELMLADIHRTLFLGVDDGGAAPADGRRRLRLAGERIDETWSGGRLVRRSYKRRGGGGPKGPILIDYGDGMEGRTPPPKIVIDNQRFGYTVTIETVTYQPL
ncbi:MAG: DUF3261 domain-containing protein [Myxococcales bacterium]|nr:DUF3261 domain-containing protein [Myxococcales bacterium]